MADTYSDKTFAQMKADVAARLGDTSMVFFVAAEIGFAINEALRIFQLLTGYWREQVTFSIIAGQPIRQTFIPSITNISIITEELYHLIEQPDWPYVGTDMFVQSDFLTPLERRRNQFLSESGLYLSVQLIDYADLDFTSSTFTLPENVLSVDRLAWSVPVNQKSNLWPTNQFDLNSINLDAGPAPIAPPFAYAMDLRQTRTVEFAPTLSSISTSTQIEVIGAVAGDPITVDSSILGVPDDFCWILKYGHMADLLGSDGQARDENRAKYCQMRYDQGLEMAKVYKKVFRLRLGGTQFDPLILNDMDMQLPGWQNQTGDPQFGAYAGGLLAFTPRPLSGVFNVTIDRYKDTPVLVDNTDLLQLDKSYYDAIIDYAVHCCSFKMGGAEFMRTMPLIQEFMSLAGEDKPWMQFDYRKLQPWDINQRAAPQQPSNQKEAA